MEKKSSLSGLEIACLIFGGASFIPLIGVPFGIVAIILGIINLIQIKQKHLGQKKISIIGITLGSFGIIFTLAIYGLLFYYGVIAKTGPFAMMKPQVIKQILTQNAGALELYKKQFGQYPQTLNNAIQAKFTIYPIDAYGTPFFYQVSENGQTYELKSCGADKQCGTIDDIVFDEEQK